VPLQNRVLPTGDIVSDPARGTVMGNRGGRLHGPDRRLGPTRWRSKAWICCALSFRGRHRRIMSPASYTELFFLDEAVALAVGHRPCAECRHAAWGAFRAAWAEAHGGPARAGQIDAALHAARIGQDRRQIRHAAPMDALPDGAFVRHDGWPCLVRADALRPFSPGGYGPPLPRPPGTAQVLTPAPTVAALASGYAPALHPSADAA